MNIIISGATGFVGKHLAKKLYDEGYIVHALVRKSSIVDDELKKIAIIVVFDNTTETLNQYMKANDVKGVIHLASLVISDNSDTDIKNLIDSNIYFGTMLLAAATQAKCDYFINTGSFWQNYLNKDYSPVNVYAATKQAYEVISQYYWETSNIQYVTLKLFDTFGPNDSRNKLMNALVLAKDLNKKISLTEGEQIIDITYIDNVIEAYMMLIDLIKDSKNRKYKGEVYTTATKQRLTLKELISLFEKTTKTRLNVGWGEKPYRSREIMVPYDRGQSVPGWKPKVTLEEGIAKLSEYYHE